MKIEVDAEVLRRMLARARGTDEPAISLQMVAFELKKLLSDPSAENDVAVSASPETAPPWSHNPEVDATINPLMLHLKTLGLVSEDQIAADGEGYVKLVAGILARAVAALPAVQRALLIGLDPSLYIRSSETDRKQALIQVYGNLVRGIAGLFRQDGNAMLAAVPLKYIEGQPGIDLSKRPNDPEVN